jgi:hypothetical protein
MKSKKEIPAICEAVFGRLPERAQWAWAAIADLEKSHKASSVVLDFRDWASENVGDDFPKGILKAYLDVASSRLSSHTATASVALKDPEVVSLARELTYASGGEIAFQDKQKSRLAEVLREFSAEEIKHAFATWLGNQDLSDPKNVSFLAGKFVQIADSLCYTAKRKKQEAEETKVLREQTAARLQGQAEQERLVKAQQEKLESAWDPLSE